MIPPRHGDELYEACGSAEKYIVRPVDMSHNVFSISEEVCTPIVRFFGILDRSKGKIDYVLPVDLFDPIIDGIEGG